MKTQRMLVGFAVVSVLAICISVLAQVNRPFHNGSVWDIAFIRVKPGMDVAYMNYLATQWKKEQEALKSAGIILSYKVIATENHTPGDWNLMLMTEFKDLSTLEASEQKAEAISQKVSGNDQQQMQGYKERTEIRNVMGGRLGREVILEPRK